MELTHLVFYYAQCTLGIENIQLINSPIVISAQTFGDYATQTRTSIQLQEQHWSICALTVYGKLGIHTTATLSVITWQVQEILHLHAPNAAYQSVMK